MGSGGAARAAAHCAQCQVGREGKKKKTFFFFVLPQLKCRKEFRVKNQSCTDVDAAAAGGYDVQSYRAPVEMSAHVI